MVFALVKKRKYFLLIRQISNRNPSQKEPFQLENERL